MIQVSKQCSSQLEVKKSKFMAYLMPYNDFSSSMRLLRENHPKAAHFVYAYRFLNDHDQIIENQSDDGEPKGSSGKPSLAVLRGHDFINTAVIIIRYFGGTKLGVGGLVRAYGDTVNLVIAQADTCIYEKKEVLSFRVKFSSLAKVEYLLKSYDCEILKKDFSSGVDTDISVRVLCARVLLLKEQLANLAHFYEV